MNKKDKNGKRLLVSSHENQKHAEVLFDDSAELFDVCYTEGAGDFLRITSIVQIAGKRLRTKLRKGHHRVYREKELKLWNEVRDVLVSGAVLTPEGIVTP